MNLIELINDVQQAALSNFAGSIFPVYRFADGGDPVHIGTCFAFEYRERRFLVTAAHVMDHQDRGLLGFASTAERVPVEIQGQWHIVSPGDRSREEDPFDFAWHELTSVETPSVPCIPESALENTATPSSGLRLLTTIGFPVSKNKKIKPSERKSRSIVPIRSQYSNTEMTPTAYFQARGMSPSTHVAMKRESRAINSDGVEENTISHRGFSGGPLIYSGVTNSSISLGSQKVLGVILEGDDSSGTIVALRLSVLLRHIDTQIDATPD